MLSYQHIYHAGNFADVQKHAVLVALVKALAQKPQNFSVLDTHAGRGLYDFTSAEALKVGEFQSGIQAFWNKRHEETPLSDYLRIVAGFNTGDALIAYPGSPKIIQSLIRPKDRLLLTEKHPAEHAALEAAFKGALNVKIEKKDGFQFMLENVPFAERRGLVLIDPSYEIKTEYTDLPKYMSKAYKKWPLGQYMIWYPLLPAGLHQKMLTAFRQTEIKNMMVSEINLRPNAPAAEGMYGSGLIIINPPFGFESILGDITKYIATNLSDKAKGQVLWLDNQQINPETGMVAI